VCRVSVRVIPTLGTFKVNHLFRIFKGKEVKGHFMPASRVLAYPNR
jgi:hypothetical protein